MAERFIRDEFGFTREDYVEVDRTRPHPAAWLAVLLGVCGIAAGGWFVYQSQQADSQPVAVNTGTATVVTNGPASIREHTYVQDGRGNTRAERIVDTQIVDASKLNADDMNPATIERRINVQRARIAEQVGPGAFTIGPGSHHTILVHYRPTGTRRRLTTGEVVDITGEVRPMPDLVAAKKLFGLGRLEGSRLGSAKYYIDADKVARR